MQGVVRIARFPLGVNLTDLGWPARRVVLGEEVRTITYHAAMESYALGVMNKTEFELPKDDELHRSWPREG